MTQVTVEVDCKGCATLLVPNGITTPYDAVAALDVHGGQITCVLSEAELGQSACLIAPDGPRVTLRYAITPAPRDATYPEAIYRLRENQFTVAAAELAEASSAIAQKAGGGQQGIAALVAEAESRFSYAHPESRFNDGMDAVPFLSCGATPGSCVDINTYLVASLRAAGYQAGYIYGYFFPQERGGITDDGHCWVVTRHDGNVLEWDIAHHFKAGLGPTKPGLNPRPGKRFGISHSMGHFYKVSDDATLLKILGEPIGYSHSMAPIDPKITVRMEPWS
ncbi:transglutaminase-like domain-containing protein [Ruegeria sp.]|uniref:transglutaminase-like domain-containing protein n=1 Tax=Ruegeria sp. TaxID=1879320 RepID=UPI003C7D880D